MPQATKTFKEAYKERRAEQVRLYETKAYRERNAYYAAGLPFIKFFSFSGRATRLEYWMFFLMVFVVGILLDFVYEAIGYDGPSAGTIFLIPTLAVSVRRMHDLGRSGWYAALLLGVSSIGALYAIMEFVNATEEALPAGVYAGGAVCGVTYALYLVLMALKGQKGENKYGENPYEKYSRPESQTQKILSAKSGQDAVMEIYDMLWPVSLEHPEQLSQAEKNFVWIELLEAEVNNGGFSQYFVNSSGDNALETELALQEIGSTEFYGLLKSAIDCFPNRDVPKDRALREDLVDQLPESVTEEWENLDSRFYECKEDLADLLVQYVQAHGSEFR
jgi:uncharacterized membrane protein YhaH (DUF805 family)